MHDVQEDCPADRSVYLSYCEIEFGRTMNVIIRERLASILVAETVSFGYLTEAYGSRG